MSSFVATWGTCRCGQQTWQWRSQVQRSIITSTKIAPEGKEATKFLVRYAC